MAFKGINALAQERIKGWHLPPQVVRKFVQDAVTRLRDFDPSHLPYDSGGLFIVVDVDDVVDARGGFIFELRIKRNDIDF